MDAEVGSDARKTGFQASGRESAKQIPWCRFRDPGGTSPDPRGGHAPRHRLPRHAGCGLGVGTTDGSSAPYWDVSQAVSSRLVHAVVSCTHVAIFWQLKSAHFPGGHLGANVLSLINKMASTSSGRTTDEQDAYATAQWLADMDRHRLLAGYFTPPLTDDESNIAGLEGWILGIY